MIINFTPQMLETGETNPAWMALRLGKPSASCAAKILTSTGKVSTQRDKYLKTLAGERVSGRVEKEYYGPAMRRGHENEAQSRLHYEMMHNVDILTVGCVFPDEGRRYLCSPDGLIMAQETGFETKDACFSVQIERLQAQKITMEPAHFCQVQMSMLVTGWSRWIYTSYCQDLPALELVVERDEKYCSTLRMELDRFCNELDQMAEWLRSL